MIICEREILGGIFFHWPFVFKSISLFSFLSLNPYLTLKIPKSEPVSRVPYGVPNRREMILLLGGIK